MEPTTIFTSTPVPILTPTPTPEDPILIELLAVPSSVEKSKKATKVTVLAKDQNGNPIKDIIINAEANGRKASVNPSSAFTNADGKAEFEVKFSNRRKRGSVTFEADGVTATVNQNK